MAGSEVHEAFKNAALGYEPFGVIVADTALNGQFVEPDAFTVIVIPPEFVVLEIVT